MQEDITLLAQVRALDPEALTRAHELYYRPIFRYISFRVSEVKVAEDLTSEVFTRLLSALRDRTAPQKTLRGWLFSVAARVVADHYRKQHRTKEVGLSDMIPDERMSPDEDVSLRMRIEQLRSAMKDLTEEQQRVLALRFGSGMRIREVARILGKSEGAVKQLQLRAISTLAQRMVPGEGV